ncbi:hypothetical protein PhCBS80983_g04147 [Powellomyces hirtus]|uniref:tRNA-uridine aminocarboxypropyltransferase 1 n=1 Tax=Powellomyces hirtus TaxID=109895 RepID=A0A507E019_9FUNG|nr:hypothetical protein PhCBS80983_g04147 [Powellomyces hirtus]
MPPDPTTTSVRSAGLSSSSSALARAESPSACEPTSDPWSTFHITPTSPLRALYSTVRQSCAGCGKGRKVFCPKCGVALGHDPPRVALPVKVVVYRDPREVEAKSTSAHAKILAPAHVEVKVENLVKPDPSVPSSLTEYTHPERVLLLFPSDDALPLSEVPDLSKFDKLIVLDGTWKQGRAMATALAHLPFQHVSIQTRTTLFWRYQPFGEHHLSTIEATYWFFRDHFAALHPGQAYDGRYDDLLFYFKLQWELIQEFYKTNREKTFTTRKLDAEAYIRY